MAKLQTKIKKEIKKDVKRNPLPYILAAVFLVLGLLAGGGTCYFVAKDDAFVLNNADTEIVLNLGDTYTEPGAKATAFGKDVSDKITITGEVDINTPGVYAITYTCDSIRYKDVQRIRYVTVLEEGE